MAWRHICDICGRPQATFHPSPEQAREAAQGEGWTQVKARRRTKVGDLCPTCTQARAEGPAPAGQQPT